MVDIKGKKMILVDFGSLFHRSLHGSIKAGQIKKNNGLYRAKDYYSIMFYLIISEIFRLQTEHTEEYGEMVICTDQKSSQGYWRTQFYSPYKSHRKQAKDQSDIDFKEAYGYITILLKAIQDTLPIKIVGVDECEADDCIMVLSKKFSKDQKILIVSPDKDFIQCQFDNNNVKQISPATGGFVIKDKGVNDWIEEHICLGDAVDEIPKITDDATFSNNFIDYLLSKKINITVKQFNNLSQHDKDEITSDYSIYKKKPADVLDIYEKPKIGVVTFNKIKQKYGGVQAWLDTNEVLKDNYARNEILIMESGIPERLKLSILNEYENAKDNYERNDFWLFLQEHRIKKVKDETPPHEVYKVGITLDDLKNWIA